MCRLKTVWQELISSLLSGSCGCIEHATVLYKIPVYESCQSGLFANPECKIKEETEELKIAAFFSEQIYDFRNKVRIPQGQVETLTDIETTRKLVQAHSMTFLKALEPSSYTRKTAPEPCGFGEADCKYYSIIWEKC